MYLSRMRQNKYTILGAIVVWILFKLGVNPYVAIGLILIYCYIIFGRSKREDSDEDKDVGLDGDN